MFLKLFSPLCLFVLQEIIVEEAARDRASFQSPDGVIFEDGHWNLSPSVNSPNTSYLPLYSHLYLSPRNTFTSSIPLIHSPQLSLFPTTYRFGPSQPRTLLCLFGGSAGGCGVPLLTPINMSSMSRSTTTLLKLYLYRYEVSSIK